MSQFPAALLPDVTCGLSTECLNSFSVRKPHQFFGLKEILGLSRICGGKLDLESGIDIYTAVRQYDTIFITALLAGLLSDDLIKAATAVG